jgi:hypothetical protein
MYAEIQGGFTAVKAALELVKAGKGRDRSSDDGQRAL